MTLELKTTPIHDWHQAHHANMAAFAGYDMPLWYETGVKTEHYAVLQSAGIFDTSHMACILVTGFSGFDLLNLCFTRDIAQLQPMRCRYGAFLNPEGISIDDAVIYKLDDTCFMVCVNAGMGSVITTHLKEQLFKKKMSQTHIIDLTGKTAKIDVQGPASVRILSSLIRDSHLVFSEFPYFSFKGFIEPRDSGDFSSITRPVQLKDGTGILLSRSGYTGELGFEIFISPEKALFFWETLLDLKKKFQIVPCGLGARDSLRTGACLPLSHQDIGRFKFINHPWEFCLPFKPDRTGFTKSFIGDAALLNEQDSMHTYPFVGTSLKKISTAGQTRVMESDGKPMGTVLSCVTDMAIDWFENKIVSIRSPGLPENFKIKGLACGFIGVDKKLEPGACVTLSDGKRSIDARIATSIRPDLSARKNIQEFI